MKIGMAVLMVGFLNFIFGGHADKDVDFSGLLKGGALVVDVRSTGEFSGGHADGAVNIPYNEISEEIGRYAPDKNQAIILYCRSGARASVAKKRLSEMGYATVVNAATLRNMQKIIGE